MKLCYWVYSHGSSLPSSRSSHKQHVPWWQVLPEMLLSVAPSAVGQDLVSDISFFLWILWCLIKGEPFFPWTISHLRGCPSSGNMQELNSSVVSVPSQSNLDKIAPCLILSQRPGRNDWHKQAHKQWVQHHHCSQEGNWPPCCSDLSVEWWQQHCY